MHALVLSHTRLFFLEEEDDGPRPLHLGVTHASVATNCSVLNHLIGSIIGFTLLLGLEIEKFKTRRLRWRREVLVNVRAAHGTNTTRASSAWCAVGWVVSQACSACQSGAFVSGATTQSGAALCSVAPFP